MGGKVQRVNEMKRNKTDKHPAKLTEQKREENKLINLEMNIKKSQ